MDSSALETLVDEAIAANAGAWDKFVGGEDKAIGALVGAVMKARKGQADGKAVTALLQRPSPSVVSAFPVDSPGSEPEWIDWEPVRGGGMRPR